jgi:hypothetical protein
MITVTNRRIANWLSRRLASLSFIVGLLSLPISAQAQGLPEQAAHCALNLALFRVFQVTGVWVGTGSGMAWVNTLINNYPKVPDPYLVANACEEVSRLPKNLALMPPEEHEAWRNMWAASVPHDLALLAPMSADARQLRADLQSRAAQQNAAPSTTPNNSATNCVRFPQNLNPEAELQYLFSHPNTPVCPSRDSDPVGSAEAITELQRRMQIGESLLRFDRNFYGQ